MTMSGIAANPDEEALKELLDVFGSQFSLEDIASAYYEAKGDVNFTGEILCTRNHGETSSAGAETFESKSEDARTTSVELSTGWESASAISSKDTPANHNTRALKSKKSSVSMGSISGVIGKNYVKSKPSKNDSFETTKPVKIDSDEVPVSMIWNEEGPASRTTGNGSTDGDLSEFLFKMLGDGFQLDKSVIQQTLDSCGYDVTKTVENLLDLSASTLEKSDDLIGIAAEKFTGKCPDDQFFIGQDSSQCKDFAQSEESMIGNPRKEKDRATLERDILQALFVVPERFEEAPKTTRLVRAVSRSNAFGELVTRPLSDADISSITTVAELQKVSNDVGDKPNDDEISYDFLRQAVKEYWITMKEYYKAALEAFAEGDRARASKLIELGQFFYQKAREADEKSSEKILESSEDQILSLDLRNFEPKEALKFLRLHLTSVSGIPTFKFLRLKVGSMEEGTKKGARKRLIIKQLEKESIKWNEEENGQTISFRVDEINPKRLSFAKNKN